MIRTNFKNAKKWLHQSGLFPTVRGLFRAMSLNHRLECRLRQQFFSQFLRPGDLCFDIGANLGQSVEAFLASGASVVALEPNPQCMPTLKHLFGRNDKVTIINKAVGSTPGTAKLHFSGTASTASLRETWNPLDDQTVVTEVITLAELIDEHGSPKLLKVDVEGYEVEVFKGLDRQVPLIYFEMRTEEMDAVSTILSRLEGIGTVEGVNAVSEDHSTWLLDSWVSREQFLTSLPPQTGVANVCVRMR
jgi:FkbM family methyltransferase